MPEGWRTLSRLASMVAGLWIGTVLALTSADQPPAVVPPDADSPPAQADPPPQPNPEPNPQPNPPPAPGPRPPGLEGLPWPLPEIKFEPDGTPILPPALLKLVDKQFVKDGAKLDLPAVIKHFEDLYRSDASISEAELTVIKPNLERTLGMKMWSRGEKRALVVIQSPAREKGTTTLKVDKNLWNYFPKIKRTIRVPPSAMLASWMGSDFTNDDLVRESSYSQDYTYQLVGISTQPLGWLIRFTAKEGMVGLWQRFDVVLTRDGTLPIESRWYDRKGRLARTLSWDQVKDFGGKMLPARMTLIPADEPDHRTIMVYSSIQFGVEVEEDTFSLTRLERQR